MPSDLNAIYAELCKLGMPRVDGLEYGTFGFAQETWRIPGHLETQLGFQVSSNERIASALVDQRAGDWWLGQEEDRRIDKYSRSEGADPMVACCKWNQKAGEWQPVATCLPTIAEAVLAAMLAGE